MRTTIVLAILAVAAPARADGNANELVIGGGTRALRAPSADALTADSLDGGSLAYARRVVTPTPALAVWAEAGLDWGIAHGTLFQSMTTEIDSVAMTIGGRARYSLHRRVAVSARLQLGTERASLALTESGRQATDAGWGTLAAAALATDLFVVKIHDLGLGVRAELGYIRTSKIGLAPSFEPTADGTLKLPMTDASLGHLDLSGPTFHVSLIGDF